MVRLEALLDSWTSIRRSTARAVEDFPAAELDFTAPGLAGEQHPGGPRFREKMARFALPPAPAGSSLGLYRPPKPVKIDTVVGWL
jgi:hypothetical protein